MFADRLKLVRKEAGLTQVELAKALNISTGAVGNWETGKRQPDMEMLKKLSEYFCVSADYLLDNEEIKPLAEDREIIEGIKGLTAEERKRVLDFIKFTKQQREGK